MAIIVAFGSREVYFETADYICLLWLLYAIQEERKKIAIFYPHTHM